MSEELKTCPFCGSNECYIVKDYELVKVWVKCGCCGADTRIGNSVKEAIEAWNRRVASGKQ